MAGVEYYSTMQNEENVPDHTIKSTVSRNFVFTFFGLFAFTLGYHALFPTLPIYLANLGSNMREIGVLVGILGVSALFSRLIAGGALRKYSEKSVMMFGALLFALTFLAFIVFRSFWPLFAVSSGYFFSANAAMLIAGRVLGGKIVDTYNKEKIILAFPFTAMVAMVILSFSRTLPLVIFVGMIWGAGSAFFFPTAMASALEYAGSSDGTANRIMFLCLALISLINLCYFQFYVRTKSNMAPTV
jgi:MFS family permease